jgi:hypothetical protein
MSRTRVVTIIFGIVLLVGIVGFWGRGQRRSAIAVTPVGRTNAPDGSLQFVIAITNQTRSTRRCIAGRTKVFTLSDGSKTSNYMNRRLVQLAPHSGTNIVIDSPPQPDTWLIEVSHQRVLSKPEISTRALAFKFHLLRTNSVLPDWERMGSFEVRQ